MTEQLLKDYIEFAIKFNLILGEETKWEGRKICRIHTKQNKNYYIPFTFKQSFKIRLKNNFRQLT